MYESGARKERERLSKGGLGWAGSHRSVDEVAADPDAVVAAEGPCCTTRRKAGEGRGGDGGGGGRQCLELVQDTSCDILLDAVLTRAKRDVSNCVLSEIDGDPT